LCRGLYPSAPPPVTWMLDDEAMTGGAATAPDHHGRKVAAARAVRPKVTERWLALLAFLLLAAPVALFLVVMMPTGEPPDEPMHLVRADSLLHGELIGHRVATLNPGTGAPDAGVTSDPGLALAAQGFGLLTPLAQKKVTPARLAMLRTLPWWPRPVFLSAPNTGAYGPLTYVPAAAGLEAARLLGLGPYAAIHWARFANTVVFVAIGGLALVLARRGRLMLLVVLGLPMTLALASAAGQDGLLIALACLGVALFSRGDRRADWWGTALFALVIMQRPPYLPLVLLPLVAGSARWPMRERVSASALMAAPALLWSAAVAHWVAVPLRSGTPYPPGPLWPGDPHRLFRSSNAGAQLTALLHHPIQAALLPLHSLAAHWKTLSEESVGLFGFLDIPLPLPVYVLWFAAIVAGLVAVAIPPASASGTPESAPQPPLARLAVLGMILGSVWLIYLTLYMTWTPVGALMVEGIQGRYFLPLLPVLILAMPRFHPLPRVPRVVWVILPIAALCAGLVATPLVILRAYYWP
jgi:hypothetical protein